MPVVSYARSSGRRRRRRRRGRRSRREIGENAPVPRAAARVSGPAPAGIGTGRQAAFAVAVRTAARTAAAAAAGSSERQERTAIGGPNACVVEAAVGRHQAQAQAQRAPAFEDHRDGFFAFAQRGRALNRGWVLVVVWGWGDFGTRRPSVAAAAAGRTAVTATAATIAAHASHVWRGSVDFALAVPAVTAAVAVVVAAPNPIGFFVVVADSVYLVHCSLVITTVIVIVVVVVVAIIVVLTVVVVVRRCARRRVHSSPFGVFGIVDIP